MSRIIRSVSARWRLVAMVAAVAVALVVGVLLVQAEPVPRTFAYQGVLTDDAGNPITGDHSITIRVYSDWSTGTPLCSETEVVTVTNGLFRMVVGDGGCTVDPAWFTLTAPPYLGITVDTTTLSPRVPLFPVASAYQAEHAESADRLVVRYGTEEISVGGVYCGPTGTAMTGAAGGYPAVKAMCETACADSAAHVCSAEEMGRSLQLGMTLPRNAWFSPGVGAGALSDCMGWRAGGAGTTSSVLEYLGADPAQPYPRSADCNGTFPFLCCL